jgi:hypothetical protein
MRAAPYTMESLHTSFYMKQVTKGHGANPSLRGGNPWSFIIGHGRRELRKRRMSNRWVFFGMRVFITEKI